jgi:curli biogenesis system outer membrane secretion channel CsgG
MSNRSFSRFACHLGVAGVVCMMTIVHATARAAAPAPAVTSQATSLPPVDGPRRTVAVAPFGATSHFQAELGFTDVGGGLAAMLTSALMEAKQFVVVERAQLSMVLAEQELGANQLANAESAVQPGALIGAQLLIVGEVSEFSDADKGRGFGLGLSVGGKQLGLSPQSKTGTVALDVRVIDTASAQVVATFRVRETVKARSIAMNVGYDGHSASISDFLRTPIGQAARAAIAQVVQQFAAAAARQPWRGSVVDVDSGMLVINAGADSGVQIGDQFEIHRVSKLLTDPVSGRVLERRTSIVGHAVVQQLGDALAYARYTADDGMAPVRGDMVVSDASTRLAAKGPQDAGGL